MTASTLERLAHALADRYRVDREVGAGGMATVYLAHDLKHNRPVAIKVLRDDLTASLGKERFLREISIAAGLSHPHILPVHDSGEAAGSLYYVMPYVEGPSLRDRVRREGALPVHEAVRILRDLADAMAYAHSRGVVHRDIKPENVMLSGRHALVADFGVAKAVSEATGRQTLTTVGVALGTPAYMSPEQASADPLADHRSDIYAFGVVAYELLAGRPPFEGTSPQQVLAAHVMSMPAPLTSHRASIPPALAALVMQCLEKKAADRPQTADALVSVLEAVQTPSGGITPTETAPFKSIVMPQRRRYAWLAGVALVVVVIGVGAALWRQRGREGRSTAARADMRPAVLVLSANGVGVVKDSGFAEGFQEELRATVAKISGLRLLARVTTDSAGAARKSPVQLGRDNGADYLLETTIATAPASVRVIASLVNTASGDQVWSETYQRGRTASELFAVQTEIARAVAGELQAAISLEEERRLAQVGTKDLKAYELYLRAWAAGNDYEEPAKSKMDEAQALLEEATARDSSFALAFARLAGVHGWFVLRRWDQSEARKKLALATAERAMKLAPELPESHLAMSQYYYRVTAEYPKALEELRRAEGSLRGDGYAALLRAYILRRLGRSQEAVAALEEARLANPRSDVPYLQLVQTYRMQRRYREAIPIAEQGLERQPTRLANQYRLARVKFEATGSTSALREFNARLTGANSYVETRWLVEFLDRRFDAALAVLNASTIPASIDQTTVEPVSLMRGWTYLAAGDSANARRAYSAALICLDSLRAANGDDHRLHRARALALAGLGRKSEALTEAQRAIDLWPPSKDAVDGPLNVVASGMVAAQLGEPQRALAALTQYFTMTSYGQSRAELRLDPRWAALRGNIEFQKLVAEPSAIPTRSEAR